MKCDKCGQTTYGNLKKDGKLFHVETHTASDNRCTEGDDPNRQIHELIDVVRQHCLNAAGQNSEGLWLHTLSKTIPETLDFVEKGLDKRT